MITSLSEVHAYPLTWPAHQPRTLDGEKWQDPFRVTLRRAVQEIEDELHRIGVQEFTLSSNLPPMTSRESAKDPGVSLWFELWSDETQVYVLRVLASDSYATVRSNVRAIGLTLERLRDINRYGVYTFERAMFGAQALPMDGCALMALPDLRDRPWWVVLGLRKGVSVQVANTVYRQMAKELNDSGQGNGPAMYELNRAIEDARKALGGKP